MVELLGFMNMKMESANIPYEFGEWTSEVVYPYFVGSYLETDSRFEDRCTTGTFTLDGWARGKGAKITLSKYSDKIKEMFLDLQEIKNNTLFFVKFSGSMPVPTGEDDLYKITITLDCHEWKGTSD